LEILFPWKRNKSTLTGAGESKYTIGLRVYNRKIDRATRWLRLDYYTPQITILWASFSTDNQWASVWR
jgi:hypothetical protein